MMTSWHGNALRITRFFYVRNLPLDNRSPYEELLVHANIIIIITYIIIIIIIFSYTFSTKSWGFLIFGTY